MPAASQPGPRSSSDGRGGRVRGIAHGPSTGNPGSPEPASLADQPTGRPNGGLPTALSSLVGREGEIAELTGKVAGTRLLTLTGQGGSGKTRLALAVAQQVESRYADGVWWVSLAALTSQGHVSRAVATVLGIPEVPGQSVTQSIVDGLRGSHALLVFDNCEHVLDETAALTSRLLSDCHQLQILLTSQQSLGIEGERIWPVPPLSVPELSTTDSARVTAARLRESEAAALFEERARSVLPGFGLTDDNAADVAQICRRLDGIPLAIELAAAKVRVLAPREIADRLDDSLRMLVSTGLPANPRHRALEVTMDWSYELLTDPERRLFARLAVFSGGCTLEAVESVAFDGEPSDASPLDLITRLVDRSLVVVVTRQGGSRYRLLETVRQYAEERLVATGDADEIRDRHARYVVALAERAEPELTGTAQREWLDRLDVERNNMRAALSWCLGGRWPAGGLRLAAGLRWFWYLRGYYGEGREWLGEALRVAGADAGEELRAKARVAAGMLAHLECDYESAAADLTGALATYRAHDDGPGVASALQVLGSIARERGDYAEARRLHEESLALWRWLGDSAGEARSLNYLGFAAWLAEDFARAEDACERAGVIFRRLADGEGTAWSLISLGACAHYRGDRRRAAVLLTEALRGAREIEYREGIAWALNELGLVALADGDPVRACRLLEESMATHHALRDRWRLASVIEALALVATIEGDFVRGVTLLAAAGGLREQIGTPIPQVERAAYDQALTNARSGIDQVTLDTAWVTTIAHPPERTITALLRDTRPPALVVAEPPAVAADAPAPELVVTALGAATVHSGDRRLGPADWTYAKPRELLYYLLGQVDVTKDQIGAALWPWASPAQLRNSFHTTLHHLRRALGDPGWVVFRRGRYAFDRSRPHSYDVTTFESLLLRAGASSINPGEAVRLLTEATAGYGGDFLTDLAGEDWIAVRRAELRQKYDEAMVRLGRLHLAAGRYAEATEVFRRAVAHDALSEAAHRGLIECHARLGESGRALQQYRALVEILHDELGVAPSPETIDLYNSLRRR